METDTVHKVLIKVLADEGIECELDERGRYWILSTIAKPGASEEERREAARNSRAATKILRAVSRKRTAIGATCRERRRGNE